MNSDDPPPQTRSATAITCAGHVRKVSLCAIISGPAGRSHWHRGRRRSRSVRPIAAKRRQHEQVHGVEIGLLATTLHERDVEIVAGTLARAPVAGPALVGWEATVLMQRDRQDIGTFVEDLPPCRCRDARPSRSRRCARARIPQWRARRQIAIMARRQKPRPLSGRQLSRAAASAHRHCAACPENTRDGLHCQSGREPGYVVAPPDRKSLETDFTALSALNSAKRAR